MWAHPSVPELTLQPWLASRTILLSEPLIELESLHQAKVKECARELTGDDKPRKLDPLVRKKVLDCASGIMPAMDTNALLKQSADQLR